MAPPLLKLAAARAGRSGAQQAAGRLPALVAVAAGALLLLVALVFAPLFAILAEHEQCPPPPGSGSYVGEQQGGVAGTGITAAELLRVRRSVGAGVRLAAGAHLATHYGPPWDATQGFGVTAGGIDLRRSGGPTLGRKAYVIAVDPHVISLGQLVYVWPNPYGRKGPFVAADTGGAISGRHIDIYNWDRPTIRWGSQPVRVSARPLVGGSDATDIAAAPPGRPANPLQANPLTGRPGNELLDRPQQEPGRVQLSWPTAARTITSPFGPRSSPCPGCSSLHEGVDIGAPAGAPVLAAAPGRVVFRGWLGGYGNYLCLRHGAALATCYGHLARFASYRISAPVGRGAPIGSVGQTGLNSGPHLHFEVRLSGGPADPAVDPLPYLHGAPAAAGIDTGVLAGGCQPTSPDAGTLVGIGSDHYSWPVASGTVGQGSNQPGGSHDPALPPVGWQSDNALDILVRPGTPVIAVADGSVCDRCGFGPAGPASSRYGGQRFTLNTDGNAFYYAHLQRLAVRPGQRVRRGQLVGYSGVANDVAHLHLAVRDGRPERLLGVIDRKGAV